MEAYSEAEVVVLGAGVVGLTTALLLAKKGYKHITVLAKHMPGDHSFEYTSIWAGVNFVPVSKEGSEEAEWDVTTWEEMNRLAAEVPAAGVWIQNKTSYFRNSDRKKENLHHWFRDLVYDYKILAKDEVPPFADWGTFYRTVALDPSIYLHYLQSSCLELGVKFARATLDHIREAFFHEEDNTHVDVVVNCTGLWASKLGGVMDEKVVPMRGQLVIVANESKGMFGLSGDDNMIEHIGECCYVIDRPAGGGTAIGGSYYLSWDSEPDMDLAKRIQERAIKICPNLVPPGAGIEALRVLRHQVGLRPLRMGGPRIEAETLHDDEAGKMSVVHCYGAGGFGFQSSYGMAGKAVELVGKTLSVKASL